MQRWCGLSATQALTFSTRIEARDYASGLIRVYTDAVAWEQTAERTSHTQQASTGSPIRDDTLVLAQQHNTVKLCGLARRDPFASDSKGVDGGAGQDEIRLAEAVIYRYRHHKHNRDWLSLQERDLRIGDVQRISHQRGIYHCRKERGNHQELQSEQAQKKRHDAYHSEHLKHRIARAIKTAPMKISQIQAKPMVPVIEHKTSLCYGLHPRARLRINSRQRTTVSSVTRRPPRSGHRTFFSSCRTRQLAEATVHRDLGSGGDSTPVPSRGSSIREKLRRWQIERQVEANQYREEQDVAILEKIFKLNNLGSSLSPMHSQADYTVASSPLHTNVYGIGSYVEPANDIQDLSATVGDTESIFFEPGDVMEFFCQGKPQLAVLVRRFDRQSQLYTMDGQWMHRAAEWTNFALRGFFSRQDVEQIAQYLPSADIPDTMVDQVHSLKDHVPRQHGAFLINQMQAFARKSADIYRAHAQDIDGLYLTLAEEKRSKSMTLEDITRKILRLPLEEHIEHETFWAVHRHLATQEFGLLPAPTDHWRDPIWEILPQLEYKRFKQVRQWMRTHQEQMMFQAKDFPGTKYEDSFAQKKLPHPTVISDFAMKARHRIMESRAYRQVSSRGGIGPSKQQIKASPRPRNETSPFVSTFSVPGPSTSVTENIITRFMESWAAKSAPNHGSAYMAIGSSILRAVGMYEGHELTPATGYLFLQELGVLLPWENRLLVASRLNLPGSTASAKSDFLLEQARHSLDRFELRDQMEHLRKDWTNLDVFCIDSDSAQEIDDGFSLEPVPGDEEHNWIHVHIANPTAFINPDHPMAKYAAEMTATCYFPERTFSMLPRQVTTEGLSLDANRPCLTISSKLNARGEIVDYKIVSGRIKNVIFLTPEKLQEAFPPCQSAPRSSFTYTVGHNEPPGFTTRKNMTESIGDRQKATLSQIMRLAAARWQRLKEKGSVNFVTRRPEVAVFGHHLTQPCRDRCRRIEGDPTITVHSDVFEPYIAASPSPADDVKEIVPTLMILAGEVAGRWCSDRGIPAPFRGTVGNVLAARKQYWQRAVDNNIKETGKVPLLIGRKHLQSRGQSMLFPSRHVHEPLAVDYYLRATSPLRRYVDMIAHWQIESALRREAQLGRSLVGDPDISYLPFSKEQLGGMLRHLERREQAVRGVTRQATQFWYLQLLHRAYCFGEGPTLPETFNLYVVGDPTRPFVLRGMIRELKCPAIFEPGTRVTVEEGDWWEVKIKKVDLYRMELLVSAVRLIERTMDNQVATPMKEQDGSRML